MVIAAFVAVRGRAVRGVRVRGGRVPVGVIMGVSVAAIVMRERHALAASDCRHALHRKGQGQQQHSKKAEERLSHRRAL
jgi:hypothetical protein